MQLWIKNLNTFMAIDNEEKTIETRVWKGFISTLSVGDIIDIIYKNTHNSKAIITRINYYINFDLLCDSEDISKIFPQNYYNESIFMRIKSYYSIEQINKYGIVAIHIQKIKD